MNFKKPDNRFVSVRVTSGHKVASGGGGGDFVIVGGGGGGAGGPEIFGGYPGYFPLTIKRGRGVVTRRIAGADNVFEYAKHRARHYLAVAIRSKSPREFDLNFAYFYAFRWIETSDPEKLQASNRFLKSALSGSTWKGEDQDD